MVHATKICDPCGREFTPAEYLTETQAAETLSCSRGCSSARARGYSDGPGRKIEGQRGSDAVGGLEYDYRCNCIECVTARTSDRSALIAEEARKRGMGIVPPGTPREKMKPSDLAKLAAKLRKARLETYEPETDANEEFDSVYSKVSGASRSNIGGRL
jgi:hypothetical protein